MIRYVLTVGWLAPHTTPPDKVALLTSTKKPTDKGELMQIEYVNKIKNSQNYLYLFDCVNTVCIICLKVCDMYVNGHFLRGQ